MSNIAEATLIASIQRPGFNPTTYTNGVSCRRRHRWRRVSNRNEEFFNLIFISVGINWIRHAATNTSFSTWSLTWKKSTIWHIAQTQHRIVVVVVVKRRSDPRTGKLPKHNDDDVASYVMLSRLNLEYDELILVLLTRLVLDGQSRSSFVYVLLIVDRAFVRTSFKFVTRTKWDNLHNLCFFVVARRGSIKIHFIRLNLAVTTI